jgi:hypothetical protein
LSLLLTVRILSGTPSARTDELYQASPASVRSSSRPTLGVDRVGAAHYDEIALLDTSSRNSFSFTAKGKTDAVIDRLKEEAAKLGANGVLLEGVGDQSAGSVSTGHAQATATSNSAYASGIGISGNVMIKKGSGVAIYVAQN